MILFHVRNRAGSANDNEVVIVLASNREDAKIQAFRKLRGHADQYTVQPLTRPGEIIHFANLGTVKT